jgi:hypothetical protein
MLVRSYSEPNFLFDSPLNKQYKLKLVTLQKLVSYGEFIKNNPRATKAERRNAIKNFYDKLLNK